MKWAERIFFLALGSALWFFLPHLLKLQFKYEYDVADVFNFIVTLFVAYYIGAILSRKYSDWRIEKDMLISQAREILELVKEARALFLAIFIKNQITPDESQAMIGLVKNIANEIYFLENVIEQSKRRAGKIHIASARSDYSLLRTALTGGGFPSSPYSNQSRTQLEEIYRRLRISISSFILEVNKS